MKAGLKPTGIYQRIKNPLVDARVREMRAHLYPSGLYQKQKNTTLQLMKHVRRGGSIAILADLRENSGIPVPFFGTPAPSNPFPALVARTLEVPMFAWHNVREPGVRFRMWVEEIDVPRTDDRDADVAAATASLQAAFERSIRERPEQWMWAHRRWG